MSLSLTLACLWVLSAAGTAMLPMRWQYAPGLTLLILSVPLAVFVGMQHGAWPVLAVAFAVLSMFRRPLFYLARRLTGRRREEP